MIFPDMTLSARLIFAAYLFVLNLGQLVLCIAQFIYGMPLKRRAVGAAVFMLLFCLTWYSLCSAFEPTSFWLPLPVWGLALITAALVVYWIESIVIMRRRSKGILPPVVIKETVDNMDSGILFADKKGRLKLINNKMGALATVLLGSYPQTLDEIEAALENPSSRCGVQKIDPKLALYSFPDGTVWRFGSTKTVGGNYEELMRITAQDVTEIYNTTERLREENEELSRTIAETKKLYVRLADRIREQESLALKTKVHNDIGASLISISSMIDDGSTEDIDGQVKKLQNAVWYFSENRIGGVETFDDVLERAKTLRVELSLTGKLPADENDQKLVALAAWECASNCKKHAAGDKVWVDIVKKGGRRIVTFTNNGKVPDGEIKEGGGLSTLRYHVQRQGGVMKVLHYPRFSLILELSDKNKRGEK